jgi:hypothetical protein
MAGTVPGWGFRVANWPAHARIAADLVIDGKAPDATVGATHYYAIAMKKAPGWAVKANETLRFAGHFFFDRIDKTYTVVLFLYNICMRMTFMTPLDQLLSWHGKWVLKEETVTCRNCGARQPQSAREGIFPHDSKCPERLSSLNPWQSLDEVRSAFESSNKP